MASKFISKNPFTNQILSDYQLDSADQLLEKVERAHAVQQKWGSMPLIARVEKLTDLSRLLVEKKEQFAQLISAEMGKPLVQACAEIEKCVLLCQFYQQHAAEFLAPETIAAAANTRVYYQPLGVILQVMPWNFPFWQVFRFSVPALMAGNASLLKHAENVPQCAEAIAGLFEEAGFPAGLFQNCFAAVEAVEDIITHPLVKGVALTGSAKAGSAVAALAGKHIKPVVLELGGSDAFIVWEDADLELAAKIGVQSRFGNNGQTCIAAKRFILHESIADQFLALMKAELRNWTFGDPMQSEARLTTMARIDLAETLQQQVNRSIELGAKVELCGGRIGATAQFAPMILSNIKKGMPAYEEELFGPVAALFTVSNEAEALELANDTIYGLGAAVWTRNQELAHRFAMNLEVGAVAVNNLVRSNPSTPFGGVKQSGIGRELGKAGILEFVNVKSVHINDF